MNKIISNYIDVFSIIKEKHIPSPPNTNFLYVIEYRPNRIKIGLSENILTRLKSYKPTFEIASDNLSSIKVGVWGPHCYGYTIEQLLMQMLASKYGRVTGNEWFKASLEDAENIIESEGFKEEIFWLPQVDKEIAYISDFELAIQLRRWFFSRRRTNNHLKKCEVGQLIMEISEKLLG